MNMIKVISFLLIIFTCNVSSQYMPVWNRSYSSEGTFSIDKALFVAADNTGNIIVTGVTNASLAGDDITTIKYDKDGNLLWIAVFNGSGNYNDRPAGMVTDNSDNIYITGSSTGSNGTATDILTLKYNKEGQLLWQKTYAGKGGLLDEARSIAVDGLGNVYISGSTAHLVTENSGQDWITIKYDTNGEVLWIKGYDDNITTDRAETLTIDHDGNLYVAGQCGGPGYHLAVAKYDSAGNLLWMTKYDGKLNSDDKPSRISTDGSGNVYITGYSSELNRDFITMKLDGAGKPIWINNYNGAANAKDEALDMLVDASGNVYVLGLTEQKKNKHHRCLIKYNSGGSEEWIIISPEPISKNIEDLSIMKDSEGNIIVTGSRIVNERSISEMTLHSYSPEGILLWQSVFLTDDGTVPTVLHSAADLNGNFYTAGYTSAAGNLNYCLVRFSK